MNHFNRDAEKGLSAFDQTHSIKVNYSYELPFGPDKKYLREGARRTGPRRLAHRRRACLRVRLSADACSPATACR